MIGAKPDPKDELAWMQKIHERQLKDRWHEGIAAGLFIGFWVGAIFGPPLFAMLPI